jgi:tetratricopeptide (TPR) repeat protein
MRNTTLLICISILLSGCTKFLDKKSDLKLAVPATFQDLEALLQSHGTMNFAYTSAIAEAATDNILLTSSVWGAISIQQDRIPYIWDTIPTSEVPWSWAYTRILHTNIIIEKLEEIDKISSERKNKLQGKALFYRALTYFDLLQFYAEAYDPLTADQIIAVPIRRGTDIDEKLVRNTLKECLQQIHDDLTAAGELLLPIIPERPIEPSLAAVHALHSKYYLMVKDYQKAEHHAQECLKIKSGLLNYNTISQVKYPFDRYNTEVIFFNQSTAAALTENRARVEPTFYSTYSEQDLRKKLFFTKNADGYYMFTADYAKSSSSSRFTGITTAEILFGKAESLARQGKTNQAIQDIKMLVENRYINIPPGIDELEGQQLLHFILQERRKELVYRGVRWFDLKRLSKQELGVQEISRTIEDGKYKITIDQLKKFRFTLPENVTNNSDFTP